MIARPSRYVPTATEYQQPLLVLTNSGLCWLGQPLWASWKCESPRHWWRRVSGSKWLVSVLAFKTLAPSVPVVTERQLSP